jgi:hypothetical protein
MPKARYHGEGCPSPRSQGRGRSSSWPRERIAWRPVWAVARDGVPASGLQLCARRLCWRRRGKDAPPIAPHVATRHRPSGELRSADTGHARWCWRSAMEPARDTPFHARRYWRYRRSRRRFTVDAEVEPATTAVIPVAGQGDEGFLVAEQLTQKMGHVRLPDEAFHCRGQCGSGERPSRRQRSWFCDADPSQTRRRATWAASHPSAASTISNDGGVMLDFEDSALPTPHPDPLAPCLGAVHTWAIDVPSAKSITAAIKPMWAGSASWTTW